METAMIVHLGRTVSGMDAKQATHENRIVACLQKRGPLRENDVKLYTAAIRSVGREVHEAAIGRKCGDEMRAKCGDGKL